MSDDKVIDSRTGEVSTKLLDLNADEIMALLREHFSDFVCDRDPLAPEHKFSFLDPRRLVAKVKRPPSPLEQLAMTEAFNRARLQAQLGMELESPEDADDFDVEDDDFGDSHFGSGYEVSDMMPEFLKAKDGNYYDRKKLEALQKKASNVDKTPLEEAIQTANERGEPTKSAGPRKKRGKLAQLLDALDDSDE